MVCARGPGEPAWSEWFCGAVWMLGRCALGVHGSGLLAVTVDSGNADVPIIDTKPANQTASTTRRDAPCCATPMPPHTDRLIRPADAFNPSSTCSRVRPVQKTVVTGSPAGILHPTSGISRISSLASSFEIASSMTRS